MFYYFSRGLAGYPFAFSKRSCSRRPLPRELSFPLSFIPTRMFYDPEELKQCSHMFSGQSKNHHATTYHRPTCLDTPSTTRQPSLLQNARPYSVHILPQTD
ncbi:hypothetical protein HBI56_029530 [Parastagonospora nodorum]|nr:hypothetical protein HBH49_018140 [Parastagonospora nodorum]KAH4203834.1 hypothetical protein HBH42_006330 [Parastagonospora nodorum]KAH4265308.1 hypothetical protein HBI03_079910 [Parastagonospora nodorum]KAH4283078.1 hypothetical protein HBI04_018300 [Parastagonospora nodorum]KAH4334676.1 hypothetical protein HBH98_238550 [Parastagonospora nodorum]